MAFFPIIREDSVKAVQVTLFTDKVSVLVELGQKIIPPNAFAHFLATSRDQDPKQDIRLVLANYR